MQTVLGVGYGELANAARRPTPSGVDTSNPTVLLTDASAIAIRLPGSLTPDITPLRTEMPLKDDCWKTRTDTCYMKIIPSRLAAPLAKSASTDVRARLLVGAVERTWGRDACPHVRFERVSASARL